MESIVSGGPALPPRVSKVESLDPWGLSGHFALSQMAFKAGTSGTERSAARREPRGLARAQRRRRPGAGRGMPHRPRRRAGAGRRGFRRRPAPALDAAAAPAPAEEEEAASDGQQAAPGAARPRSDSSDAARRARHGARRRRDAARASGGLPAENDAALARRPRRRRSGTRGMQARRRPAVGERESMPARMGLRRGRPRASCARGRLILPFPLPALALHSLSRGIRAAASRPTPCARCPGAPGAAPSTRIRQGESRRASADAIEL